MSMNEITSSRSPLVIATEIMNIRNQTSKILLMNSIEIGKKLVEAKELVSHGEWGKWLEENVNYSQRTANVAMQLYQEYGIGQTSIFNIDTNPQTFAKMGYSQAVALLNVPQEDRALFVEEHDVANMSARELQKAIKERNELQKQLDESNKAFDEKTQRLIQAEEQLKKQLDEKKQLENEVAHAKESGSDDAINRLQATLKQQDAELKESKEQISLLRKQLKDKPIDVPVAAEKIPEEVQKELDHLRATQNQEKAVLQFQVTFDTVTKSFKELLNTLTVIQDQTIKQKYAKAVGLLLENMKKTL